MYYNTDTLIPMRDLLHVNPAEATPIWRQIEEGLRRLVASRALPPGAAVPSVRDLARDLRVNPATVAKAYQRLAEAGLLEARVDTATWAQRQPARPALAPNRSGHGRELFGLMRAAVGSAEEGACALFAEG